MLQTALVLSFLYSVRKQLTLEVVLRKKWVFLSLVVEGEQVEAWQWFSAYGVWSQCVVQLDWVLQGRNLRSRSIWTAWTNLQWKALRSHSFLYTLLSLFSNFLLCVCVCVCVLIFKIPFVLCLDGEKMKESERKWRTLYPFSDWKLMFPVVLVKWVPSVFAIIDSEVSKMHYFFLFFIFCIC